MIDSVENVYRLTYEPCYTVVTKIVEQSNQEGYEYDNMTLEVSEKTELGDEIPEELMDLKHLF